MKYSILSILVLFANADAFNNNHTLSIETFDSTTVYPAYAPYHEDYLSVSSLHKLYYAEFGNPNGVPVLVVHGGPGAGCYPAWSGYFDPEYYHVIMLDQRGAGKSLPAAEMNENTTQHLINDMEVLRQHLHIDSWILFGLSWGSALSLLYAEQYPQHVQALVIQGVFLARKQDYEHLFYGMKQFYPEAWDVMVQDFSPEECNDLISAFHARIMNPDTTIHLPAAHTFMRFDCLCTTLLPYSEWIERVQQNDHLALTISRAFIHYSAQNFFVEENQILNNINAIQHIPTIIIQGRYDIICPIAMAYELYKHLPQSTLWIVANAGHFSQSISRGLCYAMNELKHHTL